MKGGRWYWVVGAISLFITILLLLWLTNYSRANPRPERLAPKSLEAYREQFRRPDGTPLSDDELRRILQAKGIAYHEACIPGQNCPAATTTVRAPIPDIEFAGAIAPARREDLRTAVMQVLGHQLEIMRQHRPELRLERIIIDSGMRLQLYFNADFAGIAEDESRLNDFSEGLHVLGTSGLRGSSLFIDGQPLGIYLQKKDAERDRAARAESPEIAGESRR